MERVLDSLNLVEPHYGLGGKGKPMRTLFTLYPQFSPVFHFPKWLSESLSSVCNLMTNHSYSPWNPQVHTDTCFLFSRKTTLSNESSTRCSKIWFKEEKVHFSCTEKHKKFWGVCVCVDPEIRKKKWLYFKP